MIRKPRIRYTAQEKVALLGRHLLEKVAVSDICREHGLQPTVFYRRQQEFFEYGAAAFQCGNGVEQRNVISRQDDIGYQ